MSDFNDFGKKHRVIGIRHTLRKFKDEGLVEEETRYPDDAVEDVKDELLYQVKTWYRIGAKRGALEILEAILNGDLKVIMKKNGSVEQIEASVNEVSWKRGLNVKIGEDKKHIKKRKYKLTIKELGFE